MTAVTADRLLVIENPGLMGKASYPMKATTGVVYGGALVMADSSGNVTTAADTASTRCVGVAIAGETNTGAAGAKRAEVINGCDVHLAIEGTTLDATDIGKTVYTKDNATVCDATEATNDIPVGELIRLESATVAVVRLLTPGFSAS